MKNPLDPEAVLREIIQTQGIVCENFELCKHVSCMSSCASWMIADKYFDDKAKFLKEEREYYGRIYPNTKGTSGV